MEAPRPDERTRLFHRKESLADFAKYDHSGLSKILEVGRLQSTMLPAAVQPAVNALIMFVEMNSLVRLALYATFVVCLVAFGLFLLIVWGKCLGETDNTAIFLFMVTTVLGGDPPDVSDVGICPYINVVMTLAAFLINVLGIGLVVNKMTQPQPKLVVSRNAVVKMRNGILMFQCRNISPHGHYVTDLSVKMVSFINTTSLEGDDYMEIKELRSECVHRGGVMPTNMNHFITKDSPLYGVDFKNFNGWIEVIVSGFDEFLGTRVSECMLFGTQNIRIGCELKNCFITTVQTVVKDPSRKVEVDMVQFHNVEPVSEKWKGVIELALSAAKTQRESKNEFCLEVGHEARYYTQTSGCCDSVV